MTATIIENTLLTDKRGFITLHSPEFAAVYRAGQVCMLSVRPRGSGVDPLLRRPFAPYSIDKSGGNVSFAYNIVGKGTSILAKQQAGELLSLSVPSGKHFKILENSKVALLAGGVGIAPMHCLAHELYVAGCDVTIYYGARIAADILPKLASSPAPFRWVLFTEDGSLGSKGFATNQFKEDVQGYDMCYTCGPKPMMKVVQQICASAGKPVEVSLEEVMGCAIGACCGCMVNIKETDGSLSMKRCCTEGPVFDGHRVAW